MPSTVPDPRKIRVCFLFKGGRKARLTTAAPVPGEFFYGASTIDHPELDVDILEEDALGPAPPTPLFTRIAARLFADHHPINLDAAARFCAPATARRVAPFDILVATTNSQGLALSQARKLGLIGAEILFMPMGVMALDAGPIRRARIARLLGEAHVAPISKAETAHLQAQAPGLTNLAYLPFGVDTAFWSPAAPASESTPPYVLAIGNDPRRDWATLAQAWGPDLPPLKVVTRLSFPPGSPNIEVIEGDWRSQHLGDADIRDLYRGASLVVVPLGETIQPAGQSVCLQAMACGKPVILSDIRGLWDRDALVAGGGCTLVAPGAPGAIRQAVETLMANDKDRAAMGRRARLTVEEHFSLGIMTQAMTERLLAIAASLTSPPSP